MAEQATQVNHGYKFLDLTGLHNFWLNVVKPKFEDLADSVAALDTNKADNSRFNSFGETGKKIEDVIADLQKAASQAGVTSIKSTDGSDDLVKVSIDGTEAQSGIYQGAIEISIDESKLTEKFGTIEGVISDIEDELALKAVKTEVNAALALKADQTALEGAVSTINGELALKAVKTEVDSAIALKADQTALEGAVSTINGKLDEKAVKTEVNAALDLKVDKTEFNGAVSTINGKLDEKAIATEVNAALDLKANKAEVESELAKKAIATEVNAALDLKANKAEVESSISSAVSTINGELAKKAVKTEVDSALALKANQSDLDSLAQSVEALASATQFIGVSTTAITDGGTQKPTINGESLATLDKGDIVIYSNLEFIWDGSKWCELGDTTALGARISPLETFVDDFATLTQAEVKTAFDEVWV